MAIRRIVAAIDVVINGQRNIDRLANSYVATERAVQAAARATRSYTVNVMGAVRASDNLARSMGVSVSTMTRMAVATANTARGVNSFLTTVRAVGSSFRTFTEFVNQGRDALENSGRTTRGLRDNLFALSRSMLLFSVMLPLVQLPQRIMESFADFIKVGAAWNYQMRTANALLGLNEEQLREYNVQVQQMAIANGVATESMSMFVAAASSVAAIEQNTEAYNRLGREAYNASVALDLANASARLARATSTDAAESQNTLIQVMSTYRFGVEELANVSDSLFAITDVGNVRFKELESTLPRVSAAMGPFIANAQTAADKQRVMNESFAAFAAMTQVMPADMAATSFANIFKDISQMTGQQRSLVQTWERIRVQQGLGRDMSLDPTALIENGPMAGLMQLRKVLDLQSPLITAYVANQRRMGNTADEAALRMTGQMQIAQAYFEDMRAVRGFVSTTPELLSQTSEAFGISRRGGVAQGIGQIERTYTDAANRLNVAWDKIKTSIFDPMEAPAIGAMNPITQMFSTLLENTDFRSGNMLDRIRFVAGALMDQFANWFRTGGRDEIRTVGREIGTFIGDAVTSFFRGGKENVLVEAGQAFSEAFIAGIGKTLPDMLGEVIRSSLTRGLVTALAVRYVTRGRVPELASRGAAIGVPFLAESQISEGGIGGAAALAATGLFTGLTGFAALRRGMGARMGAGIPNIFAPGGMIRNPGQGLGAIANMLRWRSGNPAVNTPFPTAGRGWPGYGRILRAGAPVGGNALLAAAMSIPEIFGAESDRARWEAIGGAGGGILGAGLGGLAGGGLFSLLTGFAGGMAGGALGRWGGGALYDLFNPATGRGGTVANADAPERAALAETFAMGVDASLAVPLLTEIRDVLTHGVPVGGLVGSASTGPVRPAAGGGTGRGLEQSFVYQLGTGELTEQQAQAACGPAAAAFFAKAYGRNPTLGEAYALVTELQGGDPTRVGGTRGVGTVGAVLNRMGVANEVQTGGVDWGRLANNATAGIPGIVNIGPNAATGFGGHYFQIGGWNPANNTFNVGPNTMKGMGRWLTPEQMTALGPALGAVYGTGGTGSGVTAADVASIPAGGTGMGVGLTGGGGPVTISIQNLMNVEHIDGQTDVRALMGQMADILRQLSSGGSVTGQTGAIAP